MEQIAVGQGGVPAVKEENGLVTADKVAVAVERIVELARPLRVVVFGSRARGDHRKRSDLDLAVILDNFDPKKDKRPVGRTDLDVWMPVDLLVVSRERHEFMRDSRSLACTTILRRRVSFSMILPLDQSIIELLNSSRDDEETLGLEVNERTFGLHAQQAVEKLLKAAIGAHDERYKYTHDISELSRHFMALGERLPFES